MADIHTITIDLNDIRVRAKAVSEIKLNKTTTPNEVIAETLTILKLAAMECRMADLALAVDQQRRDQEMADAGYGDGDVAGGEATSRQQEMFRDFADSFTRRITALERLLEARNEAQE